MPAALRATGLTGIPLRGPLAITVPGAVRSWGDAHRALGRLSRDAILAPAIELAATGFPAWDGFIAAVEAHGADRRRRARAGCRVLRRSTGRTAAPWRPGELVRLPALAATLERLADDGFDAFYDGDLGERQARASPTPARRVTADDLRDHRSTWDDPIATTTAASG